jgi:hypothetical protein
MNLKYVSALSLCAFLTLGGIQAHAVATTTPTIATTVVTGSVAATTGTSSGTYTKTTTVDGVKGTTTVDTVTDYTDGATSETVRTKNADGSLTNTETDTSLNGSKTVGTTTTDANGNTTSTSTTTAADGTSKTSSKSVTTVNGVTTTRSVTSNGQVTVSTDSTTKTGNTTVETKTVTNPNGVTETIKTTAAVNTDGSRTTTTQVSYSNVPTVATTVSTTKNITGGTETTTVSTNAAGQKETEDTKTIKVGNLQTTTVTGTDYNGKPINQTTTVNQTSDVTTVVTPVNGQCGPVNGVAALVHPVTNLCAVGQASGIAGHGPWTWTCAGTNEGTNANCQAPLMVNGACGASNGHDFNMTPTGGLCTSGTATAVTGNGPWGWTCAGANGGTNATCAAQLTPINGVCGTANGTQVTAAPTAKLCATGVASAVTGNGPWAWACAGDNGGINATCSAQVVPVNGTCGTANNTRLSAAPTANLCATGTATAVAGQGPWTWACNGSNGGTNATCSAATNALPPMMACANLQVTEGEVAPPVQMLQYILPQGSCLRDGLNWNNVELKQGVYTMPANIAKSYANVAAAGMYNVVTIGYGNKIYGPNAYQTTANNFGIPTTPAQMEAFKNYAVWAVSQDGTGVANQKAANIPNLYAISIWNELNGSWNGGISDYTQRTKAYATLVNYVLPAIRQANPNIKIILGASVGVYVANWFYDMFITYHMLGLNDPNVYLDVHPYLYTLENAQLLNSNMANVRKAGIKNPIFATEWGSGDAATFEAANPGQNFFTWMQANVFSQDTYVGAAWFELTNFNTAAFGDVGLVDVTNWSNQSSFTITHNGTEFANWRQGIAPQ